MSDLGVWCSDFSMFCLLLAIWNRYKHASLFEWYHYVPPWHSVVFFNNDLPFLGGCLVWLSIEEVGRKSYQTQHTNMQHISIYKYKKRLYNMMFPICHIHSTWLHQPQTNPRSIPKQCFTIADVEIYPFIILRLALAIQYPHIINPCFYLQFTIPKKTLSVARRWFVAALGSWQ